MLGPGPSKKREEVFKSLIISIVYNKRSESGLLIGLLMKEMLALPSKIQ